jgi:hypothetical protein
MSAFFALLACVGSSRNQDLFITARADDTTIDSAPVIPAPAVTAPTAVKEIVEDMRDVSEHAQQQDERVDAIENFLADSLAVKQGKAPKGWVQPPFADYTKPDAPDSFIPVPDVKQ